MGMPGSVAAATQKKMIQEVEQISEAELKALQERVERDQADAPKWLRDFITYDEATGDFYCRLCMKAGSQHLTSKTHMMRMEESAIAVALAGPSASGRRFSSSEGMLLPASKNNVKAFWGEHIEGMTSICQRKHVENLVFGSCSDRGRTAVGT
jgi:hypothetical protein